MKTKSANIPSANVSETKAESISSVLATKKFVALDYAKLSAKDQKRFRSKVRRGLFAIIDLYLQNHLMKSANAETDKNSFEAFKEYVKVNYSIPLSEVQNVFKGNGKKVEDFNLYISAFKKYLSQNQDAKAEKKAKAKK